MAVDPITLEIVRGAIHSTILEMEALVERTAMSPVIKEKKDFFVGVYDVQGRIVDALLSNSGPRIIDPVVAEYPVGQVGAATSGIAIGLELHGGSGHEWLAVNMQLRPGNSGGPLLDSQGRLIGINAIMSGPNVGLAVPSHVAKGFLKRELKAAA